MPAFVAGRDKLADMARHLPDKFLAVRVQDFRIHSAAPCREVEGKDESTYCTVCVGTLGPMPKVQIAITGGAVGESG